MQATLNGWSSTERYSARGTVRLEQSARPPAAAVDCSEDGARELGECYWRDVESFTLGLVRARTREDGLELRLLGRWTLLAFGKPETRADRSQALSRFPILGGILARAPGGSITFAQTLTPALELRTTVDGFHPRLGARSTGSTGPRALPWEIQRRLHVAISRRYLSRLVDQASR